MTSKTFASLTLAGVACLGLATSAHAGQGVPGSLLVFPEFDNTRGDMNLLTVTNTSDDQVAGSVDVEFVYINGDDTNPATQCQEFNRVRSLTPNDEISVLTRFDNPNEKKGYVYVFARSHTTGKAIKFDHLIGTELTLEAGSGESWALNPWAFTAGAALTEGSPTDLNNNGLRDLDGNEYEKAPDITRARLYLEAMEKILPKAQLYVIDSDKGRVPLHLRITGP